MPESQEEFRARIEGYLRRPEARALKARSRYLLKLKLKEVIDAYKKIDEEKDRSNP